MTTAPMDRPPTTEETPQAPSKAPIPAAVAAIVAAFRNVFRRAEDEHSVERTADEVRDTRGWNLEFVVQPDELDGGFVAECPQLPGAMSQGETEEEALDNLADAVDQIVSARLHRHLSKLDLTASPVEASVRTIRVSLP